MMLFKDLLKIISNEIIYIDKVGLEDLIAFRQEEFEIIDGQYLNEGRNNTISIVIKDLYDRLKLKQENTQHKK